MLGCTKAEFMAKQRMTVCRLDALEAGEPLRVEAFGKSNGVYKVDGECYALADDCPHRGAPLHKGDAANCKK